MNIQINQLGYTPDMRKEAVIRGSAGAQLLIKNADGECVMTLPVLSSGETLWGDTLSRADFSALTQPGVYTLCCGEETSFPLVISENPYDACMTALFDMLYYQRCGCEVEAKAAPFAHAPCHTAPARVYGTDEMRDVHGGWHDAGDFGRYIVPAAKTIADLLLARRWNPDALKPQLTEFFAEARWELEWMLRMQREDGGVFHKVSCASFCGMIMPDEEKEELVISPVSTTATGDFAACMAMAARFYAEIDPAFADTMKAAAIRAWDYLAANGTQLFKNPAGVVTGEYDDVTDEDERLWAAIELALTTGEAGYAEAAAAALEKIDRTCAPLGWADVRGYAAIEGCALPGKSGELCRGWVIAEADRLLSLINGYGITMTDSLPWGSNMDVSNHGMIFCMAHQLTGESKYRLAAEKQLHYIMGVNPMSVCYVTDFGANPVRNPHHRPSVAMGRSQPGMLSGGPASGMMDPVAKACLEGAPAGKSFVDDAGSYSTNEICIYWNSPLIALLAGLMKE